MNSIRRLEQAVTQALSVALEPPIVPPTLTMEIRRLERVLGGAGAGRPPRDRLREAVLRFRETGELDDLASTRAVCFGAVERFGQHAPLVEDLQRFPRVLEGADRYVDEPRRFRRCYRGLLHSYFAYDGEHEQTPTAGRHNWQKLRHYLQARRAAIRAEGFQPEWVVAIDNHYNLLTEAPADRYGQDLLEGCHDAVEQIKARLDISDASWLMRKLIIAQIQAATRESDEQFRRRVQTLLNLLSGHELLEDEGLTLILDRYSAITAPALHMGLRDHSVERWGNPWLERNTPKWSRVKKQARSLVTTCLKIDLIKQFFEVLAEDRGTDSRRLKFWLKYHEAIDDMYFALGPQMRESRAADTRRLRDKMGDHLLTLERPGTPRNNAFIMNIGEYVLIEFGAKSNAAYVYRRNALPFALRGSVAGDGTGLKGGSPVERLLHIDGGERWEDKFQSALQRLGIRPSSVRDAPGRRTQATGLRADAVASVTRRRVRDYCVANGIPFRDRTEAGGNFRVEHDLRSGPIASVLESWGFIHSDRGFWWRKDWPS